MSDAPYPYRSLDYAAPPCSIRSASASYLDRVVCTLNVLLGLFAISLLIAAARLIVLLLSPSQPLLALPW